MSHIFISYSRKDLDFAQKIVDALAANNLDTWIDWKSIPKGEDWEQEIYRGIEEADAFLFLISPDSVASEMCNREIAHAVKNGKRILPIVIRDTDPKIIHPEISKRNWIFIQDGQDDFNKAIDETSKAIHTDYTWLKYHTQLLHKALGWERAQRDSSHLLRGKELREAEEQLAENQRDPQPTELHHHYLLASLKYEKRQRRQITSSLVAGLLVMLGIAVLAVIGWQRAEEQARIALARQLAAQGQTVFEKRPDGPIIATLLTLESMKIEPSLEAEQVIRSGLVRLPKLVFTAEGSKRMFPVAALSGTNILIVVDEDRTMTTYDIESTKPIQSFTGKYVAASSNGRYVLLQSDDQTVHVFDLLTNQSSPSLTINIESAFAISDNGHWLAYGYNTIKVIDLRTMQEMFEFQHENEEEIIYCLAFDTDGKWLVSGASDKTARVWDLSTGKERAQYPHENIVLSIAISEKGRLVATGGRNGSVIVWEVNTGSEIAEFLHGGIVNSVAISVDEHLVLSGGSDGAARVWNIPLKQEVASLIHPTYVHGAFFGVKDRTIFTYCADGIIRAWNITSGNEVVSFKQDDNGEQSVVSDDGALLALEMGNGVVRIIDFSTAHTLSTLENIGNITAMDFNDVGSLLATGDDLGTVRIWDIQTGREVAHFEHNDWINEILFSHDGKSIAGMSVSRDHTIKIWDIESGAERFSDFGRLKSFSPKGTHLVTVRGEIGTWAIWNVNSREYLFDNGIMENITFTDDEHLMAFNRGSRIHIMDTTNWLEVLQMEDTANVDALKFSRDGKYISSVNENGFFRLWKLDSKTNILSRQLPQMPFNSCYGLENSPQGRWLVIGFFCDGSMMMVMDQGNDFSTRTIESEMMIRDFAFDQSENWMVTGTGEYEVKKGFVSVWDLSSGKEVSRVAHQWGVSRVAFNRDGNWLFSSGWEGASTIWRWHLDDIISEACLHLTRNLTNAEWDQYIGDALPYQAVCPNLPIEPEITITSTP